MLWQQCLNKLESELTDQEINTWLRTLHGTQHENILVLLAPNTFVFQHVKDHHLDNIKNKIKTLLNGENVQVILQIGAGDTLPFETDTISEIETQNLAPKPRLFPQIQLCNFSFKNSSNLA